MTIVDNIRSAARDFITHRKMQRLFGKRVDPYQYHNSPRELEKQEKVLSLVSGRKYKNGMEIGCAEGVFTKKLAPLCEKLTAVDISETALARAREHCADQPNITFLQTNIRHFPFKPEWDLMVVSEVFYYLNKKEIQPHFVSFLERFSQGLMSQGRLIVVHSFSEEEQRQIRQSYVDILASRGGLTLKENFICGNDPTKSRYLVSQLIRS